LSPATAPATQLESKADPEPAKIEAQIALTPEEKAHRAKIYVNHARDLQNA
jgi:hypothetical protein